VPVNQTGSPNDDLVRLLQAQLGESIILDVIAKSRPGTYDASVDAIVRLKALGASDRIIAALRGIEQDGPTQTRTAAAVHTATARPATGTEAVIPDGTEIRLELVERLSSASARVGEKVRLEVADDVKVGEQVVIPRGAPAIGTVTVAQSRKSFGRRGKLDFTIDSVKTPDDQNIRLRITRRAQGDERYLVAGVVSYFTIVGGFFVRGADVEVEVGTQYPIYIDGERRVTVPLLAAAR
jgi:hypothetical protein